MQRDSVNKICAGFPGATLEHPFGPLPDTWKVGGKIFALIGGPEGGITLKCHDAETADFLIDIGVAQPAPYLKRGGWVLVTWDTLSDEVLTCEDLASRLRQSYDKVLAGVPRRLRPTQKTG
ncbi:MAG: MmcQ/YjbR family DNA-binding protein [Pseudomonadota bacterium]